MTLLIWGVIMVLMVLKIVLADPRTITRFQLRMDYVFMSLLISYIFLAIDTGAIS